METPTASPSDGVTRGVLVAEADLPHGELQILLVHAAAAGDLLSVVHAAFAARPPVDPPAAALAETVETIAAKLERGYGLLAVVDDEPVGALLVAVDGRRGTLTRVAVHPHHQNHGFAGAMVQAAIDLLAVDGVAELEVESRTEFPQIGLWWQRHGFKVVGAREHTQVMRRPLPVLVEAATAEAMTALGERIAVLLRAGDVVIATGDLGAGKTTLTQGIGAGLAVSGPVISPTFVLSRVHPSTVGGPALVHVDAYRLGSFDELEDLDLEATVNTSVTLVEWGGGIAEGLADDRLEIDIRRSVDVADETRHLFLSAIGPRWAGIDLGVVR